MLLGAVATTGAVAARYVRARRSKPYLGIADVDPEPLMSPAAEGIDPDAVAAAHTELKDLRERLP